MIHTELYSNNKIDIAIDVDKDRVVQSGTYEEIKDDDIEFNYIATFTNENKETIEVELLIVDDTLTMIYDDGSEIILKESVK